MRGDGGHCKLCKHWTRTEGDVGICERARLLGTPPYKTAASSCPHRFEPVDDAWRCDCCDRWKPGGEQRRVGGEHDDDDELWCEDCGDP